MIDKKYGISVTQIYKYGFKLCLEVYEKYNRKCLACDSKEILCIHHIDGSGSLPEPNNSLDNLQLICQRCHKSIHGKVVGKLGGKRSAEVRHAEKQKAFGGYLCKGRRKEYMREYSKKIKVKKLEDMRNHYQLNNLTPNEGKEKR